MRAPFDSATCLSDQFLKHHFTAFALSPHRHAPVPENDSQWTATGKELARWQAHDSGVTALLFSRDGKTLFSVGGKGALTLRNLPIVPIF
jgi:hypothetical protein